MYKCLSEYVGIKYQKQDSSCLLPKICKELIFVLAYTVISNGSVHHD